MHNFISETVHNNYVYGAWCVKPEDLKDAIGGMRALGISGINVTAPHKVEVMKYIDVVTDGAKKLGSVNTVVNRDGKLYGYNTDADGFCMALTKAGIEIENSRILIIGAGGAARAIAFLCAGKKASEIYIMNRTLEKAQNIADAVNEYAKKDIAKAAGISECGSFDKKDYIVIQTTSVGLHPHDDETAVTADEFYENAAAGVDIIYNPYETMFMKLMKKHGKPAYNGLKMLLYQGVAAYELWNDCKISSDMADIIYEDMKKELLKAEKFIFLEFFIINHTSRMWNEILEILKKKVKQGVEVRVMYDGMGCIVTLPRKYNEYLERQGIKCRIFSPIVPLLSTHQNNRDHRKIMVIDGAVAFCGGINISDEYINEKMRFGHWKDTGFMLRGEAVAGFTAMFLEMWNVNDEHIEDCGEYIQASKKYSVSTDGFVIPFGDTPLDEVYVGKRAYINNLNNASEYTYIMTPYLVIDDEMYECMKYAAQRGVDVKIIMPHIPDKKYAFYLARTYYKELLKAGIEIYEYTPGFVHAKMSISDGKKAIVGTVNHDYRSLYLHYECAAYMLNVPAVMDIERDFKDTLELSQKITLEDVKHFNIFTKLLGHIIRLVAPLL